jgi:hypothetical protein
MNSLFNFKLLGSSTMPDSGGADPGAAEEAAEDVDDGEEDNIHVEAGPLLVL